MNYKMIFRALLFLIFINNHVSAQCSDFVRIDGKSFKCGGSAFFPVVANYYTEVCHGTGTLGLATFPYHYPTRAHEFFLSNSFSVNATNHNDGYTVMLNDFKEIKHLGFNTVRVVGATEYKNIASYGLLPWNGYESISYTNTAHTDLLLDITGDILKAAKEAQLKVILLVEGLRDNGPPQSNYTAYLASLAARFKYDATLMAIDFTNEPDIHSPGYTYNKTGSCSLTATWHNAVKNNSQILTTVGLLTKAVFSWDPNVLNVDFMSFHPYPRFENLEDPGSDMQNVIDRMKSDFLWCTNNVSVPWMVGETSVSAHTAQIIPIDQSLDSNPTAVTLSLQADYLNATLNACRDYGGAGYSWWSYMDKGPNAQVKEYLGIVECNEGIIGTFSVGVSPKPCAAWVGSFNPTPSPTTVQPSNYYRYFAVGTNTNYMISGTVTAGDVAVKDAVVELYSPVSHTCSTTETFTCTCETTYTLSCGQTVTCPGTIPNTSVIVNCSGSVTKCADEGLGFTYTNAQGQFTVHPYQSVNTASLINIFGVYARIKVTGVDCSITTQTVPTTSTANATYTIGLTKISRPTDAVVAYSSQTVTGVSINTTAVSYMTFTNYVINSGTFTARAGSYINLKPGFTAKSGSSFSARIGAYHHDCGSLTSGGTAFRTFEPTVNPKILDSQSYLYPNPGEGIYNIKMDEENEYTVLVYNMYGALIKSTSFTGTESTINIAEVSQGLYIFNVLHQKRIINSWKVIKQ